MGDRLLRAFLVIGGVRAASAWTWPGRVSRGRSRGRARPRSHAELLPRRRRVGRPHARAGRVPRRAIPHQHITELGRQDGHPCGVPVPPAGVATFAHARAHAWAVMIPRPRPAWTPTPRRSRGAAHDDHAGTARHARRASSRPATMTMMPRRSPPPLSRVGVENLASSSVRAAGVAGAGVSAAGGPSLSDLRNIKRVMGRLDTATDPAPSPGAAARTLGGGPVVKASPKGFLSRSGPCGSPGGRRRRGHTRLVKAVRLFWVGCCRRSN